ncbi:MAG TPA: phosphoribosylformylglycinamidine synthase [Negativicutes bacterium]|nr:phosphoribosylformylglycinamidine synthase [Negativicutes bacterium]
MSQVKRIYVEKKPGFDVEAQALQQDLKENVGLMGLGRLRLITRYDVSGLDEKEYELARDTVFAEPPADQVFDENIDLEPDAKVFAMEYLPGQYDQRADWAAQCLQVVTQKDRPQVASAKVIALYGEISELQLKAVKAYCINPVEAREASLVKPETLEMNAPVPPDVAVLTGFGALEKTGREKLIAEMGLAMSEADLEFCQAYFRDTEKREPTVTEIRVIDTYWSDHCRHTTFLTAVDQVEIEKGRFAAPITAAYESYQASRLKLYGEEPREMCLMDIATIGMKGLRKAGRLNDLEESEENNACSIVVTASIDGRPEEWLVMFKNETHNHPTEIEPFGGAATCLGGAIRDPLSGRAYVYQAMRVTGSADPRQRLEDTLPGKLPQRKITTGAASGYSSYGNQIGLATGQVAEVYHPGYVAKRMEIGAVIAAAPRANVLRKSPEPGDAVILVGGRTGRDGCGGATGSSKVHTEESLASCGAEVQKGNAPTERKIQRLFRNQEASRLIKKCNDFGAGGVSVAIGELADGLDINLDAVPKKYEGLDGTELAISESQERMAVVVASSDAQRFIELAAKENLEATLVAQVSATRRLRLNWRGESIVNISRDFLDTNGVRQHAAVAVTAPAETEYYFDRPVPVGDIATEWLQNLSDLNVCSQRGLIERFDSTIGAATILMPFGGRFQATPAEGMAAKIPVLIGETDTATLMAYGYNPYLAQWSPFHGAVYAVTESVAKIVAMGGDPSRIRLTLQEYFEKLGSDAVRWGKPFSALLGALWAQMQLGVAAIGGKDSMSGSFNELTVPPTLVSFAVAPADAGAVISPEFKNPGNTVLLVPLKQDSSGMPDFVAANKTFSRIAAMIAEKRIISAKTVRLGGVAAAISTMAFGNRIGFDFASEISREQLFRPDHGSIVMELASGENPEVALAGLEYVVLGVTREEPAISVMGAAISLKDAQRAWETPLEKVFPTASKQGNEMASFKPFKGPATISKAKTLMARPRIIIPVFPGTNCEYDSARAFAEAGGMPEVLIVRNLSAHDIEESVAAMVKAIDQSQILMLPGGFSAGDEPDGSGKFIAALFHSPRLSDAVTRLLKERDGLILGVCNGFQALIKLGLLPYGEIRPLSPDSPTLTFNWVGRHMSRMVETRVTSGLSPWLSMVQPGAVHTIAVSHGEGRLVASREHLERLAANGQIATQYVNVDGNPSMDIAANPNGSDWAIEGLTSPDGRIFGKMGHSERIGRYVAVNVPGDKDQRIFEAGVRYFL